MSQMIECPRCGQPAGQPCVTGAGTPTKPHKARQVAYPWEVQHQPVEILTATALRLMSEEGFNLCLITYLDDQADPEGYAMFWPLLAFNDDLTLRAFTQLAEWTNTFAAVKEVPGAAKFLTQTGHAWNRLKKIRNMDVRSDGFTPKPTSVAGQLLAAIRTHRAAIGDQSTPNDEALWATLMSARDRRSRHTRATQWWELGPTLTTQLVEAVREHQALSVQSRPADLQLWALLQD